MKKEKVIENMFNIDPKLAVRIYEILKNDYKDIKLDHTRSSFVFYLNKKLGEAK